ncbi:MAG: ATPase [Mycobacterium sp.]|nr:ATPase [Mycobacterium sp.]
MNLNRGQIGPGGGPLRGPAPSAAASTDAAPTERLTGLGRSHPKRTVNLTAAGGRRVRRTVDLPAATHRALDIWQREAADRLGVARVTGQEVLTALVDQLLADPKLAAQIIRNIHDRR